MVEQARKETNYRGIKDGQIVGDVSMSALTRLLRINPPLLVRKINDRELPYYMVDGKFPEVQAREIVEWWSKRNSVVNGEGSNGEYVKKEDV